MLILGFSACVKRGDFSSVTAPPSASDDDIDSRTITFSSTSWSASLLSVDDAIRAPPDSLKTLSLAPYGGREFAISRRGKKCRMLCNVVVLQCGVRSLESDA